MFIHMYVRNTKFQFTYAFHSVCVCLVCLCAYMCVCMMFKKAVEHDKAIL